MQGRTIDVGKKKYNELVGKGYIVDKVKGVISPPPKPSPKPSPRSRPTSPAMSPPGMLFSGERERKKGAGVRGRRGGGTWFSTTNDGLFCSCSQEGAKPVADGIHTQAAEVDDHKMMHTRSRHIVHCT
eukprot:scaffold549_cov385-Prasinococcus_capsulatus_cf.AAC.12